MTPSELQLHQANNGKKNFRNTKSLRMKLPTLSLLKTVRVKLKPRCLCRHLILGSLVRNVLSKNRRRRDGGSDLWNNPPFPYPKNWNINSVLDQPMRTLMKISCFIRLRRMIWSGSLGISNLKGQITSPNTSNYILTKGWPKQENHHMTKDWKIIIIKILTAGWGFLLNLKTNKILTNARRTNSWRKLPNGKIKEIAWENQKLNKKWK